jgi:hypothetical protein
MKSKFAALLVLTIVPVLVCAQDARLKMLQNREVQKGPRNTLQKSLLAMKSISVSLVD